LGAFLHNMAPTSRVLVAALFATYTRVSRAECPNLCSGHGSCDVNDQCVCYKEGKVLNKEGNDDEELLYAQWTGADCSMVACPRGISWTTVNGVTTHEKSAECSDAGICDRSRGECDCFEKYTGSACQRAKCHNDCSGHGVCTSNTALAEQYARQMSESINLRQRMPRCDGAPSDETCSRDVEHLDAYYDTFMVSSLLCVSSDSQSSFLTQWMCSACRQRTPTPGMRALFMVVIAIWDTPGMIARCVSVLRILIQSTALAL